MSLYYQIKADVMDGTCIICGGSEKYVKNFNWKTLSEGTRIQERKVIIFLTSLDI
jgi:hypothetical protein